MPAASAFPVPDGMSFVQAATLPVAAMTAFHAIEAGKFVDGETQKWSKIIREAEINKQ